MEQLLETAAQKTTDALLFGLNRIAKKGSTKIIKDVPYAAGQRHTLNIFLPEHCKPEKVVMFVHGGTWQYGHKDLYDFIGLALARRGIACVAVNYRLFPESSYPGFVDDVAQALKWLESSGEHYGLADAPLFLMGHSAGAHIALLASLDKAFAERFGYSLQPIKGIICLAGVYSLRPEKSEIFRQIFPLEHSGDNYADIKPVNHVTEGGIPIYILHGRSDTTVACRSAERMYKNAILANHPVFLDVRENYGHSELLFEFVDWWPGHGTAMANLERFMKGCCA